MSHAWDGLTLGGLDTPRFLLCSENWEIDPYFNDGTVGSWAKIGSNGAISIIEDDDAVGTNVLRYYEASTSVSGDYIEREFDVLSKLGTTVLGKKFIATLRIKSTENVYVTISDKDGYTETVLVLNTLGKFKKVTVITETMTSSENSLWVYVKSANNPDGFDIKVDDLFFSQVDNDFSFTQPNNSKLVFEEKIIGMNEKWNGRVQKFNRKWKPQFVGKWEYIGSGWENYRQLIYQSTFIFCIPHKDVSWGFLGIFNGDLERQYSFDRFFGHTGGIVISAVEFIQELPYDASGAGLVYLSGDDVVV